MTCPDPVPGTDHRRRGREAAQRFAQQAEYDWLQSFLLLFQGVLAGKPALLFVSRAQAHITAADADGGRNQRRAGHSSDECRRCGAVGDEPCRGMCAELGDDPGHVPATTPGSGDGSGHHPDALVPAGGGAR